VKDSGKGKGKHKGGIRKEGTRGDRKGLNGGFKNVKTWLVTTKGNGRGKVEERERREEWYRQLKSQLV